MYVAIICLDIMAAQWATTASAAQEPIGNAVFMIDMAT